MRLFSWPVAVAALILAVFPWVIQSDYYQHIIILALMWVVIGSSWNLLAGFTGQVSFGHAIFFGTGAYTAGLCVSQLGISAWWGMLLGGPVALVVGFIIGWICFRLRGPYFALATIAVGEIFRLIATAWSDFAKIYDAAWTAVTGTPLGIIAGVIVLGLCIWLRGVLFTVAVIALGVVFHLITAFFPELTSGMEGILIIQTFRSKLPYYYLALAMVTACIIAYYLVMRSKWGYYFLAIREDQDAAESLGISSFRYKSLSLMLSSFFTGLAGAFYMNYMAFIDPEVVFSLHHISIMAILVGIIGGVGTLWGPPVGAFIMVLVQETFRSSFFGLLPKWISQSHVLVFGLLVMFVILFMANGVVGDWPKIRRLWSRGQSLQATGRNGS